MTPNKESSKHKLAPQHRAEVSAMIEEGEEAGFDEILYRLIGEREERESTITAQADEIKRLREGLAGVKKDIDDLASKSDGIAGLHQNGDVATWEELLPGGRYDDWFSGLSHAASLLEKKGESE